MIAGMRRRLPLILSLAACAGVSPRPEAADADALPQRTLSAAQRIELARQVDEAVQAVVRRRYGQAEAAARAALALDPRAARARAVLGMVHLQLASRAEPTESAGVNAGEYELRLAEQLAPDDAFVGWMAAVFLAETGHTSAAADAAERALARTAGAPPNERAALLGVAGTYRYELGEERAAIPHLQAYVGLRPDDATAQFRLGASLLRVAMLPQGVPPTSLLVAQRHAEAAARAFRRCAELAPGDEEAAVAIGTASWRAAELAAERREPAEADEHRRAAQAEWRAAAERFPASALPWYQLGVAAEAMAGRDEARAAYATALQRDARHVGTLLNLAGLAEADGDVAGAAALLQRVLAADTASPALTPAERRAVRQRLGRDGADAVRRP